jgi:hypothetical protein
VRRGALPLVLTLAACAAPDAPDIPGRDEIGPPPEAARPEVCPPPYPMSFGDDWYLLADLDRGVGCVAFLERDECILGVFHDCTDDSQAPRQWRGILSTRAGTPTATLFTEHDPYDSGARLPLDPKCCVGAVAQDPDAWARFTCAEKDCGNVNDLQHGGLYLERWSGPLDPAAGRVETLATPAGTHALAVAPGGRLWGLGPQTLFSRDPGAEAQVQATLTDGRALAAGPEGVLVSDGDQVARADREPLAWRPAGGRVEALAAHPAGGWVAALDAGGAPRLARLDPSGTVTATVTLPAAVTGLAGGDGVYLTLTGDPRVLRVAADLGLSAAVDMATHLRLTKAAVVPRAPTALPDGKVAFIARCHAESSKTHCIFESTVQDGVPLPEPRRHPLAGLEVLQTVEHDPAARRLVGTSVDGVITVVERDTGRPRLGAQLRLAAPVVATAWDPAQARLYALLQGGAMVQVIDPAVW